MRNSPLSLFVLGLSLLLLQIAPAQSSKMLRTSKTATVVLFPFSDGFENGLGNWIVSGSDWDTTSTISRAGKYSITESRVGSYPANANATVTLATPLNLSTATSPVLRLWHKYSLGGTSDYCYVEVSTNGGISWTSLKSYYSGYSGSIQSTWTLEQYDLKNYRGSSVKIRFRLESDGSSQSDGWNIDDVSITELEPSASLPFSDGFENGLNNWIVSGSDWDTTSTTSRAGKYSITESRVGYYPANANATVTLVTPLNLSTATSPVLRLWHKYSLGGTSDYCYVEVSTNGGMSWSSLKSYYSGYSGSIQSTWTLEQYDLKNYRGSSVKVRFRLESDGSSQSDGWNIDDVFVSDSPMIKVLSPNGGEVLQPGTTSRIDWIAVGTSGVRLEYSLNDTSDWVFIANIAATAESYSWLVPSVFSNRCRIRISDVVNSSLSDQSDAVFSISSGAPVLPSATTMAVTAIASSTASLNGSVTPNGFATNAWFEWGPNNTLNTYSSTTSQSIGSGNSAVSVTASLAGLTSNTTYFYRVVGQNSGGTQKGSIGSFTTTSQSGLLGEYTPDANTVLLMHMNETGGNTVSDVSSNKYVGTFKAGSFVPGRFGNGFLAGDSAGILIQAFSSLDLDNKFSIELWTKLSAPAKSQVSFCLFPDGKPCNFMLNDQASGGLNVGCHIGNDIVWSNDQRLTIGKWHHVAAVFENGLAEIYIDGVVRGWINTNSIVQTTIGTLRLIGTHYLTEALGGIVDEVRISKTARDPSEFNLQLPPKNLTSTTTSNSTRLDWQNGGGAVPLMRYKIYRGIDSLSFSPIDSTTNTSFADTKITLGAPYFYRVAAVDSTGFEGAKSYVTRAATVLPGEYQVDQNTVLLLHFNEEGGAVAYDASPNQNNADLSSSIGVPGRFGRSRQMVPGVGYYILLSNPRVLDFTDRDFLIEAWISLAAGKGGTILLTYDATRTFMLAVEGTGRLSFTAQDDNGSQRRLSSRQTVDDSKWHHIALRRQSDQLSVYIDGRCDSTKDISGIGSFSPHAVPLINIPDIRLDELRFSSVARSPQEFNLQLPPVSVSAVPSGTTVNLSWQNGGGAVGLLRYKIYRGIDSTNVILVDSVTTVQYSNSGLSPGTKYYYRLSAVDSTGFEGGRCYAVSATTSSQGTALVRVSGGTFQMGSTTGYSNEIPVHSVTLGAFYIDKSEITYERWTDVRNWGLSHGYTDLVAARNGYTGTTNHPVTEVNWYDILKWCNARSEKDGLTPVYHTSNALATVYRTGQLDLASDAVKWTANGYRLATEAEWEFAARGGTRSQGYTYGGSDTIDSVAWYYSNTGNNTHPVSTKGPNELGLFDVSGNVWEWCWDWYGGYSSTGQTDPKGPTSGSYRVLRGGSFVDLGDYCRVAVRYSSHAPSYRVSNVGFRCVQTDSTQPANPIPAAPQNLLATGDNGQVTLIWKKVPDTDLKSYRIYRGTVSPANTLIDSTSAGNLNDTTKTITGLTNGTTYYFRVTAVDSAGNESGYSNEVSATPMPDLIHVTGGTFQMGSTAAIDGWAYPAHSVTVGSFYIERTEITYEKWTDIRSWGFTHGYIDITGGRYGYNPSGANNPVTEVNWYDIVKWCNARSEKDGLTPVYYTSNTLATVYRTGDIDLPADAVNWTANGYRLPTEAEWEFAARGGNNSQVYIYSGSNTIDNVAWYGLNSGNTTHVVGTKSANELGIYDMSGNVWELCWDWHGSYSSSAQINPYGATIGSTRIMRGGSFSTTGDAHRVVIRYSLGPTSRHFSYGLRCARTDSMRTSGLIPAAPTLTSPADGATGVPISPTLSWGASTEATSYRLQVSTSSTFIATTFDDATITTTSRQVGPLLNNTTYYWRVSASNVVGVSAYSSTRTFATIPQAPDIVSLSSPADGAANQPVSVVLSWSPAARAATYRLQLSTSSIFATVVADDSTLTNTSYQSPTLANGSLYYWRVSAKNAGGVSGWSSTRSFTTVVGFPSAPTLITPLDNDVNVSISPTFNWNTVSGASSYRLQVSTASDFATALVDQSGLTSTSRTVTGLANGTRYFWRVSASNASGTGSFSSTRSFTTIVSPPAAPVLSSPGSGSSNQPTTVTLSWNASTGATTYRLQVSQSGAFATTIVDDSTLTATSKQIGSLSFSTTYYWRVSASNSGGASSYSTTASFTTIPAPATTISVNTSVSFPIKEKRQDYSTPDYRLFGLPGGPIAVNSVLGGVPGDDWQVYWDNGASSNYQVAYDGSSTFQFGNGRAFWLLAKSNISVNRTVDGPSQSPAYEVEIPLHGGWNMITNPFATAIPWSRMQAANGTTGTIHTYNGSWAIASNFDPYFGYYFFNGSPQLPVLKVPYYSLYGDVGEPPGKAFDGWKVSVALNSDGVTCGETFFGVSAGAEQALDEFDIRRPRALGAINDVYFERPEWDNVYSAFASDIRAEIQGTEEWNLRVSSEPNVATSLNFAGISGLPTQFEVRLIDRSSGKSIDLRGQSSYSFISPLRNKDFTVLVGKKEAVLKRCSELAPTEFSLSQNFPNPFNPSTSVRVTVPRGSRIRLTIYNLLGQRVSTLYEGVIDPGIHWYSWNGRGDNQADVPSGVYYCRLETDAMGPMTVKMILMK